MGIGIRRYKEWIWRSWELGRRRGVCVDRGKEIREDLGEFGE